mmetsp:Transcript_1331/g.2432  ORF Transcript_1331/g.2432 Transcript_1331/m.2432 type:complete len:168 (-) Transcript_1331:699-1202(-)
MRCSRDGLLSVQNMIYNRISKYSNSFTRDYEFQSNLVRYHPVNFVRKHYNIVRLFASSNESVRISLDNEQEPESKSTTKPYVTRDPMRFWKIHGSAEAPWFALTPISSKQPHLIKSPYLNKRLMAYLWKSMLSYSGFLDLYAFNSGAGIALDFVVQAVNSGNLSTVR